MVRLPLQQIEVAGATGRFKVDVDGGKAASDSVPDKIWNDKNTIVEKKCDGHRFKAHLGVTENRLDSRRESVVDGLYVEKTDNAPHIRDAVVPYLDGTILDGEVVAGDDSNSVAHAFGSHATDAERAALKYVAFDILFYRGEDQREKSDADRRSVLERCFTQTALGTLNCFGLMPRSPQTPAQKKAILQAALDAGEEGVMIKDTSKPYGKGWTKVKREARYDVIVSGYTEPKATSVKKGDTEATITRLAAEGFIGAIIFSQFRDGKLWRCGQTSGMTDEVREEISADRDAFIGRVFEISAQERFPSGSFRHPRFVRWRDGDKSPQECIYREDEV